ncbi:unnamed protein product, partial [Durusdinium trenchii]
QNFRRQSFVKLLLRPSVLVTPLPLNGSAMPCGREGCTVECKLDAGDAAFVLDGMCHVCDHSICFHCEECRTLGEHDASPDGRCARPCCRFEVTVLGVDNLC